MWLFADLWFADLNFLGVVDFKLTPFRKYILFLHTNVAYNALIQMYITENLEKDDLWDYFEAELCSIL
jgi:hypothetical protein